MHVQPCPTEPEPIHKESFGEARAGSSDGWNAMPWEWEGVQRDDPKSAEANTSASEVLETEPPLLYRTTCPMHCTLLGLR